MLFQVRTLTNIKYKFLGIHSLYRGFFYIPMIISRLLLHCFGGFEMPIGAIHFTALTIAHLITNDGKAFINTAIKVLSGPNAISRFPRRCDDHREISAFIRSHSHTKSSGCEYEDNGI